MGRLGNEPVSFKRAVIKEEGVEMKQSNDPVFRGVLTAEDFKKTKDGLPSFARPNYFYGIDYGTEEGDKTVVAHAKMNGRGITHIVFDEYASLPDYKWYRNPIKWWKWRRLWRTIAKRNGDYPYGRAK